MIFAGPDKGGGNFKALKNWEHRSYKKFVIPTQVGIYCHAVSDFHLSPCRGAMDTRLRGYDEREKASMTGVWRARFLFVNKFFVIRWAGVTQGANCS